jgi:phenylacetate-coenzyme A ligase PaaK-like adenylate-forming protein
MLAERATQIRSGILAVVSYAEELDDSARRHLEQAFSAPVVEIYQGAEGMLAFTCPAGASTSTRTAHSSSSRRPATPSAAHAAR